MRDCSDRRIRWALLSAVFSMLGAPEVYAGSPPGCPLNNYFSMDTNTNPGTGTGAGTSLASAEASTAQVLEVLAQRRTAADEKPRICPKGSVLVGDVCQPERKRYTDVDVKPAKRPNKQQTNAAPPSSWPVQEPQFDAWGQTFVDYERRTGLVSGAATETRSQTTSGVLVGADRRFQLGDAVFRSAFLGAPVRRNKLSRAQSMNC